MKRIVVVCLLTTALLSTATFLEAQQTSNVPQIGWLSPSSASLEPTPSRLKSFRQGLAELGYVEGKNIAIEYRYAEGKLNRLPELAAELVRLKVNIIVTTGNESTRAAKNATQTIPIIMGFSPDPVGYGFVESLARPGGNITGLSSSVGEQLVGKRLELLKEAVPSVASVFALWHQANPAGGGLTERDGGCGTGFGDEASITRGERLERFRARILVHWQRSHKRCHPGTGRVHEE